MNPLPQSEIDRIKSEAEKSVKDEFGDTYAFGDLRDSYITGATREATAAQERCVAFAVWIEKEGWEIYSYPDTWRNPDSDLSSLTSAQLLDLFTASNSIQK